MSHSYRLHLPPIRSVVLVQLALSLIGCTANPNRLTERFEHRAQADTIRDVVPGAGFSHIIYQRATDLADDNATVLVYLEGDGIPSDDGTHAAIDPTPKHALAYELMARTKHPAWYLTRPCYNGMVREPGCINALWTNARYSTTVVDSMVAALTHYTQLHGNPRLLLVGYSGGGVLAVLMAARVPNVVGVVTVAANLDIEAWSNLHHYAPLSGSLNPATDTPALTVPEIHLMGGRDSKVPVASAARYFTVHSQAVLREYDDYDHVCCWEKNWPSLLDRAMQAIGLH